MISKIEGGEGTPTISSLVTPCPEMGIQLPELFCVFLTSFTSSRRPLAMNLRGLARSRALLFCC
jgi:hypothetical protein